MKQLFYISLLFLAFACNKESVQDPEEEVAQLLCEDDDYGFSIEVAGISFSTDECWLVYAPAQPNVSTEPGNPAVIKWEVPGYPLPSAIDAPDNAHEPNAVFDQFLGSAIMAFFLFPFLPPCRCLFLLFLSYIFFFLLSLLFLCFFFLNNLRLTCVGSDRYYAHYIRGYLSWVASGIVGFSRRE